MTNFRGSIGTHVALSLYVYFSEAAIYNFRLDIPIHIPRNHHFSLFSHQSYSTNIHSGEITIFPWLNHVKAPFSMVKSPFFHRFCGASVPRWAYWLFASALLRIVDRKPGARAPGWRHVALNKDTYCTSIIQI